MVSNINIWRESASLIVVAKSTFTRSLNCNYKLLCLKRSSKVGVLPNIHVFPGGVVCENDANPLWWKIFEKFGYKVDSFKHLYPTQNVPPILQNEVDGRLPKYLSLRICAIRETFEECGILVCRSSKLKYSRNGSNWCSYIGGHEILKWQQRVHKDPNEFLNLCTEYEVYPDVWSLQTWSNWTTPTSIPIKFDTMFFFSSFQQLPSITREENEIQEVKWATPHEYITEKLRFGLPQFYEISRLRNFTDIDCLSQFARERSRYGCVKYFPYRIKTRDGIYMLCPGDDLYPDQVDKDDASIPYVDKIPDSSIQNRLLQRSNDNNINLLIQNLVPKDRHIPPIKVA